MFWSWNIIGFAWKRRNSRIGRNLVEEELDHCQRFVNSERSIFQLSTPQLCILEKVFISLNNYYYYYLSISMYKYLSFRRFSAWFSCSSRCILLTLLNNPVPVSIKMHFLVKTFQSSLSELLSQSLSAPLSPSLSLWMPGRLETIVSKAFSIATAMSPSGFALAGFAPGPAKQEVRIYLFSTWRSQWWFWLGNIDWRCRRRCWWWSWWWSWSTSSTRVATARVFGHLGGRKWRRRRKSSFHAFHKHQGWGWLKFALALSGKSWLVVCHPLQIPPLLMFWCVGLVGLVHPLRVRHLLRLPQGDRLNLGRVDTHHRAGLERERGCQPHCSDLKLSERGPRCSFRFL